MKATTETGSPEATSADLPLLTTPVAINDKAVAAWLQRHPDFFHDHADLLLELSIPHPSGKAISLLERQVAVFRERQGNLQDQIHEFISNARENDNLFEKTRIVVLELLRCQSLSPLLTVISERLREEFNASAAALVFVPDEAQQEAQQETQQETQQEAQAEGSTNTNVTRLRATDVKAALGNLFARQRTYCGILNNEQQQLLFGTAASAAVSAQTASAGSAADKPAIEEPASASIDSSAIAPSAIVSAAIVSAAIVPVHLPEESSVRRSLGLPLLLIGSTEEQHFNSSLDTLFLDFIGEVLTVHMLDLRLD